MLKNLAKIYSVSNDFQQATNIISDLLTLDKANSNYYNLLSLLYEDLHDYKNSILYIKKALKIEPNNEEYLNQLKNIERKISAED